MRCWKASSLCASRSRWTKNQQFFMISKKKNIWKEKSVTQRVQVVSQRKAIFFILRYAARRVQTPSSANLTCQDSIIAVFSQKPSGLKLLGCLHTGKVTGRLQSISEKNKPKKLSLLFLFCAVRELETFFLSFWKFSEDLCWLTLGLNGGEKKSYVGVCAFTDRIRFCIKTKMRHQQKMVSQN